MCIPPISKHALDSNDIPELIVARNGVTVTVYAFDGTVIEMGNRDFATGTTKMFLSKNPAYHGIFYFFAGGGLEHYEYITVKDDTLIDEKLWTEDVSEISIELGITRDRIEEISTDKQLIAESKLEYNENNEIEWIPINRQ